VACPQGRLLPSSSSSSRVITCDYVKCQRKKLTWAPVPARHLPRTPGARATTSTAHTDQHMHAADRSTMALLGAISSHTTVCISEGHPYVSLSYFTGRASSALAGSNQAPELQQRSAKNIRGGLKMISNSRSMEAMQQFNMYPYADYLSATQTLSPFNIPCRDYTVLQLQGTAVQCSHRHLLEDWCRYMQSHQSQTVLPDRLEQQAVRMSKQDDAQASAPDSEASCTGYEECQELDDCEVQSAAVELSLVSSPACTDDSPRTLTGPNSPQPVTPAFIYTAAPTRRMYAIVASNPACCDCPGVAWPKPMHSCRGLHTAPSPLHTY
jgi:hypothetical protein